MFTGIITDKGKLTEVIERGDRRFVFETGYDHASIAMGASIACSGACLTVVDKGEGWFAADVSAETLDKTTLGSWRPGRAVNFERALKVGDELGGHLVTGHVDGVARVVDKQAEGDSVRFKFAAPADLFATVAAKGSVALDGVSLTVNEVVAEASAVDNFGDNFGVNIIPHTAEMTTLGGLLVGDLVNLEIDLLARYVQRLLGKGT